jgi:hypothetical protein
MVNWLGSKPGSGIIEGEAYLTETTASVVPSVAVPEVAVTVTGELLQDVTELPTLGKSFIIESATWQAVVWSVSVEELVEVYSAATRAAFCTVIKAFK